MGVAIKELTHPYSHTCKDCQKKKKMRLFVQGFLEKERGKRENFCLNFLRLFFQNFLTFSDLSSHFFSIYLFFFFFPHFSSYFSQKWGGGCCIGVARKWKPSISVSGYTSASCLVYPDTLMLASHFCHLISLSSISGC